MFALTFHPNEMMRGSEASRKSSFERCISWAGEKEKRRGPTMQMPCKGLGKRYGEPAIVRGKWEAIMGFAGCVTHKIFF